MIINKFHLNGHKQDTQKVSLACRPYNIHHIEPIQNFYLVQLHLIDRLSHFSLLLIDLLLVHPFNGCKLEP